MANTSANNDPWAVTRDTSQGLGVSAIDSRYTIGALGQADPSASFAWATGVYPSATSGGTIQDFLVTATTPTANMGAQINWGNAQVGRTIQGPYQTSSPTTQTVSFATSNVTNPRIDYVVMRARDPGVDPATVTATWFPIVLTGTASASPVEPSAQLQNTDLLLAAVTIRANTTQVLAGDISDRRVMVAARGAIYFKTAIDVRNGSVDGQVRYNAASRQYEGWNSSTGTWIPWGSLTQWQTWTPSLYYGGDGFISGTSLCQLGTGALYQGRFQVVGKRCDMSVVIQGGSPPFNMGFGIVNSLLPPGVVARAGPSVNSAQQFYANLYTANKSWPGQAGVRDNTNVIQYAFPLSATSAVIAAYTVSSPNPGLAGTGVPRINVGDGSGFPDPSYLAFNGTIEIQ